MTYLETKIAAAIQARSIACMGAALSSATCMDFAQTAVMVMREVYDTPQPALLTDGIHGTDEICGELTEGA